MLMIKTTAMTTMMITARIMVSLALALALAVLAPGAGAQAAATDAAASTTATQPRSAPMPAPAAAAYRPKSRPPLDDLHIGPQTSVTLEGGTLMRELVAGTGELLTTAGRTRVHYTLRLADGRLVDSSTVRSVPTAFDFTLGANAVVGGFDKGLAGARVGARRQLEIPPSQGYGNKDGSRIPGGSTLFFDVRVVDFLPPLPPSQGSKGE